VIVVAIAHAHHLLRPHPRSPVTALAIAMTTRLVKNVISATIIIRQGVQFVSNVNWDISQSKQTFTQ